MSKFTRSPFVQIEGDFDVFEGWVSISTHLQQHIAAMNRKKKTIVVELYQGVLEEETILELANGISPVSVFRTRDCMWSADKITAIVSPYLTDDRIFGRMSGITIDAYFDPGKIKEFRRKIKSIGEGIVLVIGTGASFVAEGCDLLVYSDMARWEIQRRMREHLVDNIGVTNRDTEDPMLLYKHGYFVDWRICDRLKRNLLSKLDYLLDTNCSNNPKMVAGRAITEGLHQTLRRPFSLVPFFDPGPWGGQWMKARFGLDKEALNYGWCFNCVPEENSLLLRYGEIGIEVPAINLLMHDPKNLLGSMVYERFGEEFPIRFDYLDTMEGGNLSLQVHPTAKYIRATFGVQYTQDESYYMMDAKPGAVVYLGLKEKIDPEQMIQELESARDEGETFDVEKYVQTWPVKKHDHFLIPAGTIHCSGRNSMVLEISATPYIFTFKLWDWGRLGLDGKPRPINIEHGKKVIDWGRTTSWTKNNLVNRIESVGEGDGWREERTGLHDSEFLETRRHWFTKSVLHNTHGNVNVLNVVEGGEIVVESPLRSFEPFVVHYAETFIVPACVGEYVIRPNGESEGKECATIKAYVRNKVHSQ